MDPYELAVFRGLRQSRGSKAVKDRVLSSTVNEVLNSEVTLDGQPGTVAEHLVISIVSRAIKSGSTADLKNLGGILGDLGAQKIELVGSAVDEDLERMALGSADGEE